MDFNFKDIKNEGYTFIGIKQIINTQDCYIKFVCACGDVMKFREIDDDVDVICDCNKKYHIKTIDLKGGYRWFFLKEV